MEENGITPVPRKAARAEPKKKEIKRVATFKVDSGTDRLLTGAAKKLKLHKVEFASAAIAYFAESGLNPTVERAKGLAEVGQRIGDGTMELRKQNATIGNTVVAMMRSQEKVLHQYLMYQQARTYSYMEQIETNLLNQLALMQTQQLGPMMERLLETKIEGHMTRVLSERTLLKAQGVKESDWDEQYKSLNLERDRKLVTEVREMLKNGVGAVLKITAKP